MRMNFLFPVSWVSLRWQGGQAKRPILFMFVGVILAMLVFILDTMMPPDSVISLAYPAVVLVGLIARSILAVGLFAALATMLTIGGYFISPAPIAPLATVLLNHLLAICAIWLTAGLSYFYLRSMLTLQPLAERDQLTGAYNRHYLLEKAREQIEMGQRYQMPLSLILLDVDHFKDINDTYGHSAGDRVLKYLAQLLQQHTRYVDTVCRYGGEEFVILLPMVTLEGALTTAQRIQQALAQNPLKWESITLTLTVSMGVAELQDELEGIEPLIAEADKALYEAKALGRNRIMPMPFASVVPTQTG
jgi:diguanylate cyclase (GGDEF)-like protein